MYRIGQLIIFLSLSWCIIMSVVIICEDDSSKKNVVREESQIVDATYTSNNNTTYKEDPPFIFEEAEIIETTVQLEDQAELILSQEDIELIALVTMAEAEGECEEGKRLVIDTILNRVDSEQFPDTVYDVIYQPHQFSSMWNGRVDRCEVTDDICQLVKEELKSRLNYDVIFFNAGHYSAYGTPLFQVENHYFSSHE